MNPNRLLQAYLGLNRNVRILGTTALLLLGGLAIFIAWRQFGDVFNKRERLFQKTINNIFFTNLIASGATTHQALKEVEDLFPYASGFIGLSRKKLTLREARELADRTGAEILDVAVTAQKSRKEFTGWLTDNYPSQQGVTIWVRDNLATKVIDCPDVLEVTTTKSNDPASSSPRQVFLRWPKMETWPNKSWSWTIQPQFDEATPLSRWGLARVRSGKTWGLIDEAGQVVQPPTFDAIEPFEEQGSARVTKGGKWGLFDSAGKLLANPEWEDVQHLINGFIPVKKDGQWGYLDTTGKLAIPCDWEDAWRFSPEGFAIVTRAGKRGFIDRTGKVIVEPLWDGAINFAKEGIGLVRRGDRWGLIDGAGTLLTEPTYGVHWNTRRFDLGFFPVWLPKRALLGLDGQVKFTGDYDSAWSTPSGALLEKAGKVVSLVGPDGAKLWESEGSIGSFYEGLALVTSPDRRQEGFIDTRGQWAIPMRPCEARHFENGFAPYRPLTGDKWGFIDRRGNIAVRPEWDEVKNFREGFAAVRRAGKWGFVDVTGKTVAEPTWEAVADFSEGLAGVFLGEKKTNERPIGDRVSFNLERRWSFIDKTGKLVFGDRSWSTVRDKPSFQDGCVPVGVGGISDVNHILLIDRLGRETLSPWWHKRPPGPFGLELQTRRTESPYLKGSSDPNRVVDLGCTGGQALLKEINPKADLLGDFVPYAMPSKYGLVNSSGVVLVEPTWEEALVLSPERVWFMAAGKCGLADNTGKVLIEPRWDALEVLPVDTGTLSADGKTALPRGVGKEFLSPWVRVKEGDKIRILQINGQPAIPETLPDAEYVDFYGPAHVVIKQPDGQGGFILSLLESATGKQTRFTEAAALRWNWEQASHGLLWMRDKATLRWRLMGRDGHDFQHSQPLEEKPDGWVFVEGRAALHQPDGWVVVDTTVKPISPDKWQATHDFAEGRAAVQREGKWGFLALDGQLVIPPVWDAVQDFSRGLAAVKKGDRWGYLDPQGKVAIEPVWDDAKNFRKWLGEPAADNSEVSIDVAEVKINAAAALIDRNGRLIVDPQQPRLNYDGDAMATGKDWLIVMRRDNSAAVVQRIWEGVDSVYNEEGTNIGRGVSPARAWKRTGPATENADSGWMLIDETGKGLTSAKWSSPWYDRKADPMAGGLLSARSTEQKYGLIRRDGTVVLEPRFDRIAWIAPKVAAVWSRDEGGLIDDTGAWIFRDDNKRRLARFGRNSKKTDPQFQHGLAVIEDTPKWGYARLNR